MTVRLAADENFDGRVVRGLLRLQPELDLVRVQDTPLYGASDDAVLAWAAEVGRVVLTHDVGTMTAAAWKRVRRGDAMPGLIEVDDALPIGQAIDEILLVVGASTLDQLESQVVFLPL